MEKADARAVLANLVERIERHAESGKLRLDGVITSREFEALQDALAELGRAPHQATPLPLSPSGADGTSPSAHAPPATSASLQSAPAPRWTLKFDPNRQKAPVDDDVILCLDFGTARSKAFARRRSQPGIYDLELALGEASGDEGFSVASTVWIESSGDVFVGHEALARSIQQRHEGRQRLDSLKDELTQGILGGIAGTPVDSSVNPTTTLLHQGDLISFYLGYLTDLAERELERLGIAPYVLRRFALPCWEGDRRKWGEDLLKDHLARAQVLADTFRGQWNRGVKVSDIRHAVDQIEARKNELPRLLIDRGVLEPYAAGPQDVEPAFDSRRRQLLMVVDCGAGTTDYALFVIVQDPDDKNDEFVKLWLVEGTAGALRQAGNVVDRALRMSILEREQIETRSVDGTRISQGIEREERLWKEALLRDGFLRYTLPNDREGTITEEEFLQHRAITTFGEQLAAKFAETLASGTSAQILQKVESELLVVLTGGGSSLPMVRRLAEGEITVHGVRLHRRRFEASPRGASARLGEAYPALAVAVGGAAPDLPRERSLKDIVGLAATNVQPTTTYKS
ncbi:MAG: hypothetical protein HS104_26965 [Polyangiaceae bacterium]|nr:hypothetical protein [Polyangiaceae bacterium]